MTLQDPGVVQTLNRNFVAVYVDYQKGLPNQLGQALAKLENRTLPIVLYLTDTGEFVAGTSGNKTPAELMADVGAALKHPGLAMSKEDEAELAKQVKALEKAVAARNFPQVGEILGTIRNLKGHSPLKLKAYDLIDAAQAKAVPQIRLAVGQAEAHQYATASKLLAALAKQYAGLPVADEIKGYDEAVKLLESAAQIVRARKGSWKDDAAARLNQLLEQYPDSPFAPVARKRLAELARL